MQTEVPMGSTSKHIKQSFGGESNVLNHYCTTSENCFGSGWGHFSPRWGCHSGAGYLPNNRPVLQYTSHLDEIDNQPMGQIIKTNYKSITHKDYNPYQLPTGFEELPSKAIYHPTGFIRDKGTHIPTQMELQKVFINGLLNRSSANISPKKKPTLQRIGPKDPVGNENCGHGPRYMSTEYKTRYKGDQTPDNGAGQVGKREESGYTENIKTEEPFEGLPQVCACGQRQSRPTGASMYYTDYWPLTIPNGREPLPNIETRAAVDDGFSKGNKALPDFVQIHPERVYDKASEMTPARLEWIKKNDPAEYMNAIYNGKLPTVTKGTYQGKQIDPFENTGLKPGVGTKENTGHISNDDAFVQTRDNVERFVTHYMTKFYDPTVIGVERNGHSDGDVQKLKEDGFVRSTKIHCIEPQPDALYAINRFAPYQSRSVTVRETVTSSPVKL